MPEMWPNLEARINIMKGGGMPLPASLLNFFEPRFGYRFKDVRIHTDRPAALLAEVIGAKAFTTRKDVAFGSGYYSPNTSEGKKLLSHELTHTIQQSSPELMRTDLAIRRYAQNLVQRKVVLNKKLTTSVERLKFIKSVDWKGRSKEAKNIVEDMAAAGDAFDFSNESELEREVKKRLGTTRYMIESQSRNAFGYPFTGPSLYFGPRVNYDARDYWEPKVIDNYSERKDLKKRGKIKKLKRIDRHKVFNDDAPFPDYHTSEGYSWRLSAQGRKDPYNAIVKLFKPQPPHKRTLLHCDYLLSLVHYRSLAETLGKEKFNKRIKKYGSDKIRLKWNAFADLYLGGPPKKPGVGSLQTVTPSSEKDLVIGDHAVFWNHPAYDLINEKIGNAWRLENAVLVERSGNKDIFLGHGSGRKTNEQMKDKLATEFMDVARRAWGMINDVNLKMKQKHPGYKSAVDNLKNSFPYVQHAGSKYIIVGMNKFCKKSIHMEIPKRKESILKEIPGLRDPCDMSKMNYVKRPIESAP
ncbi:MAG: DUF4157 domain-containing protein [Methanothrix sp.]|nr:DUF4157 domain-containing protein [Methanothrix sp.]